ncbi:uncharacterized protein ACJ7VT_015711 [Polymixia lowei]
MSDGGQFTDAVSDDRQADIPRDSEQKHVCERDCNGKVKGMCETEDYERESPSLEELEEVLHSAPRSCRHGDEVWTSLYLGDMYMSHDKFGLWQLGITHVLNAAHGKMCCKGTDDFYGTTVTYYGVPANDLPTFDLSPFFYPAAQFIHQALTSGGKVLVHCAVGVSRSAALVLAYLMIHHQLSLLASVRSVQQRRWIFPNRGFLLQLIALDKTLQRGRNKGTVSLKRMSRSGQLQDLELIKELEFILDSCKLELAPVDEVWPNLYIGNVAVAQNRSALRKLGITHVLNAAHSKQGSIGDQSYYGNTCVYYGIPAEDSDHFDLSQHFKPAADFIHKALKSKDGKVLVHCIMGVSRSATLVLAFLMLRRRQSLSDALEHVIQRRAVYPNRNFLSLLLTLDTQLAHKRRMCLLL